MGWARPTPWSRPRRRAAWRPACSWCCASARPRPSGGRPDGRGARPRSSPAVGRRRHARSGWSWPTSRSGRSAPAGRHALADIADAVTQRSVDAWPRLAPTATQMAILYGGSVKADNAAEIMAVPGVAGVLVGGASLDAGRLLGHLSGGRRRLTPVRRVLRSSSSSSLRSFRVDHDYRSSRHSSPDRHRDGRRDPDPAQRGRRPGRPRRRHDGRHDDRPRHRQPLDAHHRHPRRPASSVTSLALAILAGHAQARRLDPRPTGAAAPAERRHRSRRLPHRPQSRPHRSRSRPWRIARRQMPERPQPLRVQR